MSDDDYFWELDLDAVCRICLDDSDQEMTSILKRSDNGDEHEDTSILEKIELCSGLKIATDPLLPSRICNKCNTFLKVAHKFRIICKRSNDYLREFVYNTETEIIEEIEPEAVLEEYLVEENAEMGVQMLNKKIETQQMLDAIVPEDEDNDDCEEFLDYKVEESYDSDNQSTPDEKFTEIWLNDNAANNVYEENLELVAVDNVAKVVPKSLGITSDGSIILRTKSKRQAKKTTTPTNMYSHTCEVCGNSYPRKYALDAHMRRHRNERPFECEICHASFHLNFQLKRHMRKHTGDRPYKCQYCERSFSDRSSVVKHERTHRNERPYQCEICAKRFTYASVLKVHRVIHTGEKPYVCGICQKRFSRNHHLRAHLETQLHSSDPRATQLLKELIGKDCND